MPHEWIGTGSPMDWHADDASWEYTLPFDFPFYSICYRTIYISSNGLIAFLGPDSSYSNSVSDLGEKLAIAPAWDDWKTIDPYDIFIWQDSTSVGIVWSVEHYSSNATASIEAILCSNGIIRLNYDNNNDTISATIGISDGVDYVIAEEATTLNHIDTIVFTPSQLTDTSPPIIGDITQTPAIDHVLPSDNVIVSANVTDTESGVSEAILSYTTNDGATWQNVTMIWNSTTCFYEGVISSQSNSTRVKYKVLACDVAGNLAISDNGGGYYVYDVVAEFFTFWYQLAALLLLTTMATLVGKTKRMRRQKG
jgi:hypothetical protein